MLATNAPKPMKAAMLSPAPVFGSSGGVSGGTVVVQVFETVTSALSSFEPFHVSTRAILRKLFVPHVSSLEVVTLAVNFKNTFPPGR